MHNAILKTALLWLLTALLLPATARSQDDILARLDYAITQKNDFHQRKEAELTRLKKAFVYARDDNAHYKLCNELFAAYLHYQADSALHYVNKKAQYAERMKQAALKQEIDINRIEVMGVMGMYTEALRKLARIHSQELPPAIQTYYFYTCRQILGWMADYTPDEEEKKKYVRLTDLYRDSILHSNCPEQEKVVVRADKMIQHGQAGKAIDILRKELEKSKDKKQQAYLNYTLSEAYEAQEDVNQQIYYLAQTALIDLQMAVREYASLQKLAKLIYEQGNIDRAYRYLNCSMEDAVACSARLRFIEVTSFYPIIDKAYKKKEAHERNVSRGMLVCVSILALLLVVASCYLYYWMKKLSTMRRDLYTTNKELKVVNEKLAQAGKIKEVYIAYYLDRCVNYLEKLEQYRRSLEKLAMASKLNELFTAIKSEQFLKDERKAFYHEFDKSFLDLFPDFIIRFNELLQDNCKIYPKPQELLNTELRIFALIRLGVTDPAHIAHFLGYSLATVYNYRSKIRNKAKGDKESFEQRVANL